MNIECPDCTSNKVITQKERSRVDYLYNGVTNSIEYEQTYRICQDCNFEYTDWVAEEEEQKAISIFIKEQQYVDILQTIDFIVQDYNSHFHNEFRMEFEGLVQRYNYCFSEPIQFSKIYKVIISNELEIPNSNITLNIRIVEICGRRILYWDYLKGDQKKTVVDHFLNTKCINLFVLEKSVNSQFFNTPKLIVKENLRKIKATLSKEAKGQWLLELYAKEEVSQQDIARKSNSKKNNKHKDLVKKR